MVLPSPGAPSRSTWPPASSAISTPSTTSPWPTIALEISARTSCIFPARDSACWPSGLSPFCPSIRNDPVMNPSDSGGLQVAPAPFCLTSGECTKLFLSILRVLEVVLHVPTVAGRDIFLLRAVRHRNCLGRHIADGQPRHARPTIHAHARLFFEAVGFERDALGHRVHGQRALIFLQFLGPLLASCPAA